MMPFLSAAGTSFHVTKILLKVVSIDCKLRGDALGPKGEKVEKTGLNGSKIKF